MSDGSENKTAEAPTAQPTIHPDDLQVPLPESMVPLASDPPPPAALAGENYIDVLQDPLNRISSEFRIPEKMLTRVHFWFLVYTQYGKRVHILHHSKYPWLVYDIIDLSEDIETGKGPEWLRVQRAEKGVAIAKKKIVQNLKRLARNPNQIKGEFDRHLAGVLKGLPGSRKKIYLEAANMIRSQLGQRDFFAEGLRRSSKYLLHLEETFSEYGLPTELTRLPFVESSFNEKAQSKVGASGVWQIMPITGKSYGMVNSMIDERNSPIKATKMAARLLRSYQKVIQSWPLTITAYNHGYGNLQKAIKAAKSRDLPTIIERYHKGDFLFASSNFYSCFLAALHAERYSEKVFPTIIRDPAIKFEKFQVTKKIRLTDLVKSLSVDFSDLAAINLDWHPKNWQKIILPVGYILHLPLGSTEAINQTKGKLQPVITKPI
ncbi:MAG: lytic transglycosylase domain-containing protein [Bdellovibrionales bacterium]|nr:lytic transglycosylase domain-containing protein [Bdellovibrionales bacterium]